MNTYFLHCSLSSLRRFEIYKEITGREFYAIDNSVISLAKKPLLLPMFRHLNLDCAALPKMCLLGLTMFAQLITVMYPCGAVQL